MSGFALLRPDSVDDYCTLLCLFRSISFSQRKRCACGTEDSIPGSNEPTFRDAKSPSCSFWSRQGWWRYATRIWSNTTRGRALCGACVAICTSRLAWSGNRDCVGVRTAPTSRPMFKSGHRRLSFDTQVYIPILQIAWIHDDRRKWSQDQLAARPSIRVCCWVSLVNIFGKWAGVYDSAKVALLQGNTILPLFISSSCIIEHAMEMWESPNLQRSRLQMCHRSQKQRVKDGKRGTAPIHRAPQNKVIFC